MEHFFFALPIRTRLKGNLGGCLIPVSCPSVSSSIFAAMGRCRDHSSWRQINGLSIRLSCVGQSLQVMALNEPRPPKNLLQNRNSSSHLGTMIRTGRRTTLTARYPCSCPIIYQWAVAAQRPLDQDIAISFILANQDLRKPWFLDLRLDWTQRRLRAASRSRRAL